MFFNSRFPGQSYDLETGLHYNYFRDYDPATGRYIESDPIGLAGGLNLYAYAGGNPVSDTDSSGRALDSVTATCMQEPAFRLEIGAILVENAGR